MSRQQERKHVLLRLQNGSHLFPYFFHDTSCETIALGTSLSIARTAKCGSVSSLPIYQDLLMHLRLLEIICQSVLSNAAKGPS